MSDILCQCPLDTFRRRRPDKQCCSLQGTTHYQKKTFFIVTLYTGSYSVTDTGLPSTSDKLFT